MNDYMVLEIKDFPVKDSETEKDNPYLFSTLKRAFEVASEVAKINGYARVVKVENIEVINYNC